MTFKASNILLTLLIIYAICVTVVRLVGSPSEHRHWRELLKTEEDRAEYLIRRIDDVQDLP